MTKKTQCLNHQDKHHMKGTNKILNHETINHSHVVVLAIEKIEALNT